ncbi:nuclear transport factor 2 family protein [Altericroceibacterium endophyticum]|uniref:Uncharacterized protein n=1 Tax=Altericroceibacterium endophyticum TaxID=1808508 RepID=A0A6I4T7W5_9SPHN|nr:hypothetical protein [Altericroceibacterium endophyticum]MXO65885.1 hypothetical protein [Altericroceibacterium endophyticum]
MNVFMSRLAAAYSSWDKSSGHTPEQFFNLLAENVEVHTILSECLPQDPTAGPFLGKRHAFHWFASVALRWEVLSVETIKLTSSGNCVIWEGRSKYRNRQTLRILETPRLQIWTVENGRAVKVQDYLDSLSYAKATGALDEKKPGSPET